MTKEYDNLLWGYSGPEFSGHDQDALDTSVEFLATTADNRKFNHIHINRLSELATKLIAGGLVNFAVDKNNEIERPDFRIQNENGFEKPVFSVPFDFTEKILASPGEFWSRLIEQSSHLADYWDLTRRNDSRETRNKRADAFRAQFLLGYKSYKLKTGFLYRYSEEQQLLLDRFPLGLASLPVTELYLPVKYSHPVFDVTKFN